ncbi:MAG TPA: mechanosensitive ion channel family protein [Pyrinomonadaceae bacterium]|nr:mechanosensitive ion channel family protein [Pyrinomonadaceae bacterium]
MQPSEIRRQIFLIATLAVLLISSLIFLNVIDEPLIEYLTAFFKTVQKDEIESTQMSQLTADLLVNFFRIVKIILWFVLVVSIIRFVNSVIFGRALRNTSSYELTNLVRNVVIILIYIIAFFIIFQSQYPNVALAPLFTGSTILGIVVGLALQDTLGNLFAGLALQADQPFQIGDVISIGAKGTGVVETISWRGVKIRTFQNKLVIIGNSDLGKEAIEVSPKDNLNARLVFFNTLYTDPPTKTIQVLREVVRQVENVSNKIRPIVRIRNLGDNGIDWEIKYWLEDYTKFNDTDARIRERIWYAFQRENINFAYPTRTIYVAKETPEAVFVEKADAVCERLNNVAIFGPLSDEETKVLADAAKVRVFAPGESIVQEGQKGGSMFVIHRGTVEVKIKEDGASKTINTLREGDFFGEMSLFTGEPRTASVVAKDETEVLQIGRDTLKPIFEDNPNLVRALSEIIEERRELLTRSDENVKTAATKESKNVFRSVRKFFGLD